MTTVTDIRIHQYSKQLEVAFESGEVFTIPFSALSASKSAELTAITPERNGVTIAVSQGKVHHYDCHSLYRLCQKANQT